MLLRVRQRRPVGGRDHVLAIRHLLELYDTRPHEIDHGLVADVVLHEVHARLPAEGDSRAPSQHLGLRGLVQACVEELGVPRWRRGEP